MSELEALNQISEQLERQLELLERLCKIQETILILMADEQDPDLEPTTYLSGKAI